MSPPVAGPWKPQWADVAEAKLRPGGRLESCTAGFLFVDPVLQRYYLGTAGHCTDSPDGATSDGVGTRIRFYEQETGDDLGEIGTVVFDSDEPTPADENINGQPVDDEGEPDVDFTLIELDDGINRIAHPQLLTLQGPTGFKACNAVRAGEPAALHGNSTPYQATRTESRVGAVMRCNPFARVVEVAIPGFFGDSGGAVIQNDTGEALGIVSTGLAVDTGVISMDFIFEELVKAGFKDIALATMDGGFVQPQMAAPSP